MASPKTIGYGNGNSSPTVRTFPARPRANGPGQPLHAPGPVSMSDTSGAQGLVIRKSKSQEYIHPESPHVPRISSSQDVHRPLGGTTTLCFPQIMISHSSLPSYHHSPLLPTYHSSPSSYHSSPSSYHSSPSFYHSSAPSSHSTLHQSAPPHRRRIQFYHKHQDHYGFTNFSPHRVTYNNKTYPTSEHLFQSFKFEQHRPDLAEHIRTFSEWPSVAFSEARRFQPEIRSDWNTVKIGMMEKALYLKFTQHGDLRDELLATGDAELIEASDKDSFWGWGADTRGRNELGRCLERLRARLAEEIIVHRSYAGPIIIRPYDS